jgi:hypothetical protein
MLIRLAKKEDDTFDQINLAAAAMSPTVAM